MARITGFTNVAPRIGKPEGEEAMKCDGLRLLISNRSIAEGRYQYGYRRDCLEKDEYFGVFARLIFVEPPQKDGGVVKNYWGMGSRSGKSLKY
jgi:hypothetical protein